jgi:hypothetical protein
MQQEPRREWIYIYRHTKPYPYEHSEGLSTSSCADSRSHQWRLVVDGHVAYHLTHNADKSWKIFEPWWVASHWTVLPLDYEPY